MHASVELRIIQPTDAKIPFSQPWFDKIERKIALLLGGGGRTNINISDTSDTELKDTICCIVLVQPVKNHPVDSHGTNSDKDLVINTQVCNSQPQPDQKVGPIHSST